ncbi:MAG: hypothetical protein H6581_08280 [Bacteroidia bacterium]|nr:hypothetical protein [Bacteroidia bacterium]
MKRVLTIFLFMITLSFFGFTSEDGNGVSTSSDITLHFTSTLVSGNSVKIGYKIPYDGYIEFDLFDPGGEKIWYTSYVREKGEYFLALRKDKLEEGVTYTYNFSYKGKKYPGTFNN